MFQSYLWVEDMSGKERRLRKDANMLQSATGSIICSVCNASYGSETKLREHQKIAHRGGGIEERPRAAAEAAHSEDPQR